MALGSQVMKIEVNGRIRIGQLLELREEIGPSPADFRPDYVVGSVLPAHERIPAHRASQTRSSREDFQFALVDTDRDVAFENNGLTYQYGVFGGPGSGKTNTLIYLLRQLVAMRADPRDRRRFSPERKFGGLILDPKSALIGEVRRSFAEAGREREDDLVVINRRELAATGGVNLIDCPLDPGALGRIVVLAAQSAGVGGRDPFWFQQMSNAFGAILALLKLRDPDRVPTLKDMITAATGTRAKPGRAKASASLLNDLVAEVRAKIPDQRVEAAAAALADAELNLDRIGRHAAADPKTRVTVELFMQQAFSAFRESANACYSDAGAESIYRSIFDEGKVVLVSPGSEELTMSRILPSLIKLIVQRMVLGRQGLYRDWKIGNLERPVFLMADEYHMVATQIEGEPVGDAEYFSMARQFGGFAIVATQTVQQLKESGLGDAWEAVFGTLAAVIGMKNEDPDTIEYLQKRGGKKSVLQSQRGINVADGKVTVAENTQREDVPRIPEEALKLFGQGMGVVIGTTRDHKDPSSIHYVRVPEAWAPLEGSGP